MSLAKSNNFEDRNTLSYRELPELYSSKFDHLHVVEEEDSSKFF